MPQAATTAVGAVPDSHCFHHFDFLQVDPPPCIMVVVSVSASFVVPVTICVSIHSFTGRSTATIGTLCSRLSTERVRYVVVASGCYVCRHFTKRQGAWATLEDNENVPAVEVAFGCLQRLPCHVRTSLGTMRILIPTRMVTHPDVEVRETAFGCITIVHCDGPYLLLCTQIHPPP
jgi:hypothetical protein